MRRHIIIIAATLLLTSCAGTCSSMSPSSLGGSGMSAGIGKGMTAPGRRPPSIAISGLSQLPRNITIDGIEVAPSFLFRGSDVAADGDTWPAAVGVPLERVGMSGSVPRRDHAPMLDRSSGVSGAVYEASADTGRDLGQIEDGQDFVFEFVVRTPPIVGGGPTIGQRNVMTSFETCEGFDPDSLGGAVDGGTYDCRHLDGGEVGGVMVDAGSTCDPADGGAYECATEDGGLACTACEGNHVPGGWLLMGRSTVLHDEVPRAHLAFRVNDGTASVQVTARSSDDTPRPGQLSMIHVIGDRDGDLSIYLDGERPEVAKPAMYGGQYGATRYSVGGADNAATASLVGIGSLAASYDDLPATSIRVIPRIRGLLAMEPSNGSIISAALWQRADWFETSEQTAFVRDRMLRLTGARNRPGGVTAESFARASRAVIQTIDDDGVVHWDIVGHNWARVAVKRDAYKAQSVGNLTGGLVLEDQWAFFRSDVPEAKVLLLEDASSNIIPWSDDLNEWDAADVSVTVDAVEGPFATRGLSALVAAGRVLYEDTDRYISIDADMDDSPYYVLSAVLKGAAAPWVYLSVQPPPPASGAGTPGDLPAVVGRTFNMSDGELGVKGGHGFNAPTAAGIVDLGADRYRAWLNVPGAAAPTPYDGTVYISLAWSDRGEAVYPLGDGETVDAYVGAVMLEPVDDPYDGPSSYIPTTGRVETRAADVLTLASP